ncbi:MAG: methyltransferase domain-containing protein [Bacteroidetes bacterium]|nr:methyltransferase domain-containing protein [Bacteroidota bacterium]
MNSKGFIEHLRKKLSVIPDISDYSREYLTRLMNELPYRVKIFESVFSELLKHSTDSIDKLSVVDYGGGTGLMSSYAKWIGVGNVIYLDIFEQSSIDAQKIAEQLELKSDRYIVGDIKKLDFTPNALLSTDVIEHIYSLSEFFDECQQLNPNLIQIHVTGANPYNPVIRKRLMAIQLRNENEYHPPIKGAKPMDDYRAYKEIRRIWLKENFEKLLSNYEIERLAYLTRGKNFVDMKKITDEYLITKVEPKPIAHPTNTCDPNTGNWSEHLVSENEMNRYCNKSGFICLYGSIGFNNQQQNTFKNFLWTILNIIGKMMGKKAKYLLPLLTITIIKK